MNARVDAVVEEPPELDPVLGPPELLLVGVIAAACVEGAAVVVVVGAVVVVVAGGTVVVVVVVVVLGAEVPLEEMVAVSMVSALESVQVRVEVRLSAGIVVVMTSGLELVNSGTLTVTVPLDPAVIVPLALPIINVPSVPDGRPPEGMVNEPESARVSLEPDVAPERVRGTLAVSSTVSPFTSLRRLAKLDGSSETVPSPVLSGPFSNVTPEPRAESGMSFLLPTRLSVPPGETFAWPGATGLEPDDDRAPSVTLVKARGVPGPRVESMQLSVFCDVSAAARPSNATAGMKVPTVPAANIRPTPTVRRRRVRLPLDRMFPSRPPVSIDLPPRCDKATEDAPPAMSFAPLGHCVNWGWKRQKG